MKSKVINLIAYMEAYHNKEIFESYKYINDIQNMNELEYEDIYKFAVNLYGCLNKTIGVETKNYLDIILIKKFN